MRPSWIRALVLPALLAVAVQPALGQQASPKADSYLHKGDYLFKAGYYLKASENYRLALLEDPTSPWKKLAFGHALFAIGNYSYASYALRRGVAELDTRQPFRPDVASLFPSRRAFTQALRDLKRYVTYSPRDPAGLTVLGYLLFSVEGEERRCRDMFLYLKRLDRNDPFADFFITQLKRRAKLPPLTSGRPEFTEPEPEPRVEIPDAPPAPVDEPREPEPPKSPVEKGPPLKEVVPPPQRQKEKVESEWPKPVSSPAN